MRPICDGVLTSIAIPWGCGALSTLPRWCRSCHVDVVPSFVCGVLPGPLALLGGLRLHFTDDTDEVPSGIEPSWSGLLDGELGPGLAGASGSVHSTSFMPVPARTVAPTCAFVRTSSGRTLQAVLARPACRRLGGAYAHPSALSERSFAFSSICTCSLIAERSSSPFGFVRCGQLSRCCIRRSGPCIGHTTSRALSAPVK